jgi:hypothetical protein
MRRNSLNNGFRVVVVCIAFFSVIAPARVQGAAAEPERWEIPVRMFVGHSDEGERQILEDVITPDAESEGAVFQLCGDHYWSRRTSQRRVKSQLELWVWGAPPDKAGLKVLVFCKAVHPLVRLDPDLKLPAELPAPGAAFMTPTKRQYNGLDYRICIQSGLIPGKQRVYMVDTHTGWWSARDITVSVGQ